MEDYTYKSFSREFQWGRLIGEFQVFSYQFAIGISARKWCTGPALRIYFGPFKFWCNFLNKNPDEAE